MKSRLIQITALAIVCLASCAGSRVAAIEHKRVKLGDITITFGSAHFDWWTLTASVSDISVTGPSLAAAELRVFEDANGNGAFDAGEKSHLFLSTSGSGGLSIQSIHLSAGDVQGWDMGQAAYEIVVTDGNGQVHVHSGTL